jgi:hypothetical protein
MSASHQNPVSQSPSGVVGFFDTPAALMKATEAAKKANYQFFDAFSPYPIHGLEKAQGLRRSWLPYVTLGAGLTGLACATLYQWWTSAVSWPINVGGKPLFSWPAFVPVMFELTVLFGGLATVAAMILVNRLPNTAKKAFDSNITRDRFALLIEAPTFSEDDEEEDRARKTRGFKPFQSSEAEQFLKSIGATETRMVQTEGWF